MSRKHLPILTWVVFVSVSVGVTFAYTSQRYWLIPVPIAVGAYFLFLIRNSIVQGKLEEIARDVLNALDVENNGEDSLWCSILLYRRKQRRLEEVVRESGTKNNRGRPTVNIPVCQGFAGACWRTAEFWHCPHFLPDFNEAFKAHFGLADDELKIMTPERKSSLAAPIGPAGQLRGVLVVSSSHADAFKPSCRKTMKDHANKVLSALLSGT